MIHHKWLLSSVLACLISASLTAQDKALPEKMEAIMRMEKYRHANWGVFAKDAETGQVLYDYHSDQLFLPGSTTKLFTVAALLHTLGYDYRFKTPVYTLGSLQNGVLQGDLVLVAQGDLTFGGRENKGSDKIAYTKMDHIYANTVPGAVLTPQNPLNALNQLASDIRQKGVKEINGDVRIDDSLFESTEKRGMMITPIMINENLIDFSFNPGEIGKTADLIWRPMVEGYQVKNEVKTVVKNGKLDIQVTSDESGHKIVVKGTLPADQKNIVRTFSIKNPQSFAREAFIQALREQGIVINLKPQNGSDFTKESFKGLEPIAIWTSPPLTEYAKLILKVSHNLGANLVPLLLAVQEGKRTFDEGMLELGKFTVDTVKVSPDSFVYIDGAGGDENRFTPQAEIQVLEYVRKLPKDQFRKYMEALPILGVDGSLEDFGKGSAAVGKVFAKPGTGVSYNLSREKFFLNTQALAGYIEGENGHLIEYMIAVNNGTMPAIEDIFPIFEDFAQLSAIIYEESKAPAK